MMEVALKPESQFAKANIYRLYRDFFDLAEKKRRWNLRRDIPWHQCNPRINPAIADVVETFCAVELYLPDYLAKAVPQVHDNRGRAWMYATCPTSTRQALASSTFARIQTCRGSTSE